MNYIIKLLGRTIKQFAHNPKNFIVYRFNKMIAPIILVFKYKNRIRFFIKDNDGIRKLIPYFYHLYRKTFLNEMCLEVPLVYDDIYNINPGKVLEIGKVLPHYYNTLHICIDKYETGEDALYFNPTIKNSYKRVVSISTLEHIGFDDDVKDPGKGVRVIHRVMKEFLQKDNDSYFAFTFPIGYNREGEEKLAELINNCEYSVDARIYIRNRDEWVSKRITFEKDWNLDFYYNRIYPTAEAILYIRMKNE